MKTQIQTKNTYNTKNNRFLLYLSKTQECFPIILTEEQFNRRRMNKRSVKKLIINEGIHKFGLFWKLHGSSIEELSFPTTFKKIPHSSLVLHKLHTLTFKGNTIIKKYAFTHCPNIQNVYVGPNVIIEEGAFDPESNIKFIPLNKQ